MPTKGCAVGSVVSTTLSTRNPSSRIQTFTVSGVFEVGAAEHDNVLAFVHLQDAAAIAGTGGVPGGLRLKFTDIFAAPARVQQIAAALGGGLQTSDWSIENSGFFRAVGIEKTMMTLILMLIVAVAAFNIVAALVMVVNEKRTDIAILRTVGITPHAIAGTTIPSMRPRAFFLSNFRAPESPTTLAFFAHISRIG